MLLRNVSRESFNQIKERLADRRYVYQVIFGGKTFPLSQATKDAWPLLDRVQVSDDNDSGFKGRASVSYCKAPEDDDSFRN